MTNIVLTNSYQLYYHFTYLRLFSFIAFIPIKSCIFGKNSNVVENIITK